MYLKCKMHVNLRYILVVHLAKYWIQLLAIKHSIQICPFYCDVLKYAKIFDKKVYILHMNNTTSFYLFSINKLSMWQVSDSYSKESISQQ